MPAVSLDFVHRFDPGDTGLTVLLLHGTGGDENDLVELAALIAPGANVLSPRGKVLEDGMPRFFRRLAPGVFDIADLRMRTRELADFIDGASVAYGFPRDHVVAVGYSNGANIAASLILEHPGSVAGAGLLHAMVPFDLDPLPDLSGLPIFLSGGMLDQMVPAAETERLGKMLATAGADVSLHWERGGHQLTRGEVDALRDWFGERFTAQ